MGVCLNRAAIAATETSPDIHSIGQKELKEPAHKVVEAEVAPQEFETDLAIAAAIAPAVVNPRVSSIEESDRTHQDLIAGLPFTDLETETTENNTGGTSDIWLSPEASDSSESELSQQGHEALPEPPLELRNPQAVAQTTTLEELSDIDPNHWSYLAVQSLIEDYDCLEGFPDGTFRGNQSLTRYEFAAGLNACLDEVTQLADLLPEDQETIAALTQQFDDELIELTTDVDRLAAVIEELRANQFSPTTRLFGQVIFGLQGRTNNTADFFPVDGNAETDDPGAGAIDFYSNAQLSLISRLTRRDLLLISLQAGQGNSLFDANTNTALGLTNNIRLAYEGDTDFDVELTDLTYRRLIGDSVALIAGAAGVNQVSVFRGPSEAEGAGSGPLSVFAQRNPILSIGNGDTGLGFDWQIIDRLSLQGVYTVADGNNPSENGLFGGDRTLGFQLTASPFETVDLALNYVNSYSENGNLGTGIGDTQLSAGDALTTNAFGATLDWDVTPRFTLGGWGGYTTSVTPGEDGSVETVNWMAFMNFPDLFGPGNLGGLYVGQPPRITSSDLRQGQNIPDLLAGNLGDPGDQPGSTLHIEAFYRYQMTDNISLTPGVIVLFEPANASGSDTITIGALRTTFRF
ncbi:MAG: iron uptake porin [Leptolyngbya sp. SIOISBB]|nr:iron uptake porin [Leptolyngbya sp. SIOISBB]